MADEFKVGDKVRWLDQECEVVGLPAPGVIKIRLPSGREGSVWVEGGGAKPTRMAYGWGDPPRTSIDELRRLLELAKKEQATYGKDGGYSEAMYKSMIAQLEKEIAEAEKAMSRTPGNAPVAMASFSEGDRVNVKQADGSYAVGTVTSSSTDGVGVKWDSGTPTPAPGASLEKFSRSSVNLVALSRALSTGHFEK